jgi:hypothetical protein
MGSWSTSAAPWRTKMTPSGRCRPGWGSWRPWDNSIPPWGRSERCLWPCAWGSIPGWWWWATWGTGRAHLTQLTVNRLPQRQAVEVIRQVAHGKVLPPEVVEQIVAKTDGVPLFVEELTKMVLESGLLQERDERYALTGPLHPLAIPATLHDSLMARLDRLAAVKALAQLGATLGREFSYALLRAVAPWEEGIVHQGLHQLVAAEFLYQRGVPPQAPICIKLRLSSWPYRLE